ncbi:hypothetical protein [Chondromyces crocatus]|uniref:PE-PGRS family protein n=1 Tax=Chondromyces crocatus TaxID=52 RepID=A0A0K1EJD8_CHOCO|nr:hypothetical protein [Chondromyces crocatus]AKT40979.1 uncharacterized protein CMC5_051360 [Chondromyces crocatus]
MKFGRVGAVLLLSGVGLVAACDGDDGPSGPGGGGGSEAQGGGGGSGGNDGEGGNGAGGEGTGGNGEGGNGGEGGEGGGSSTPDLIFPPDEAVFGLELGQWGAAWWEWALGIPRATNPMLGGDCDQDQSAVVFFLTGNTTSQSEVRSCSLPAGKPIFFPIVTTMMVAQYENNCDYDADYIANWAEVVWPSTSDTRDLSIEVDGVSVAGLENHERYTGLFVDTQSSDPALRIFGSVSGSVGPNSCGVPVGTAREGASSGYWAMLKPLSAGEHVIRFAGKLTRPNGSTFLVDMTYALTVTP